MEHTIKYVCGQLGLSVHTVRHYCDMGLVPSLRHDGSGNRLFDEEAVNWLRAAAFLRASGMSIPEMRDYFALCQEGISTLRRRQEILMTLRDRARREREEAQRREACLERRIAMCQDALEGRSTDDCNPLNW